MWLLQNKAQCLLSTPEETAYGIKEDVNAIDSDDTAKLIQSEANRTRLCPSPQRNERQQLKAENAAEETVQNGAGKGGNAEQMQVQQRGGAASPLLKATSMRLLTAEQVFHRPNASPSSASRTRDVSVFPVLSSPAHPKPPEAACRACGLPKNRSTALF